MRALDTRHLAEYGRERSRIVTPQDCRERPASSNQRTNRKLREAFPPQAPVGASLAGANREHAVEQQHPSIRPLRQVSVLGRRNGEVVVQFPIYVPQTARDRPNVGLSREREPDGVTGRRIGILADDEHPHLRKRTLERLQHTVGCREHLVPLLPFRAQRAIQLIELAGDRLKGVGPVRSDPAARRELA